MKNTFLLFYVCVLSVCFGVSADRNGNLETCTTFNGTTGECIIIQNCPSLFDLSNQKPPTLANNYIMILSTCGEDGESKVCCDLEEDLIEFVEQDARPRFLGPIGTIDRGCSENERCILTKQCPKLLTYLNDGDYTIEKRDFFIKVGCGFDGGDPMVCCPEEPIQQVPENLPTEPIISDLLPNVNECGPIAADRIVGGLIAEIAELPWMALLEYKTKFGNKFNCGGSLINRKYILTAAHCIKETLINVRLGEYDISKFRDCPYCDYPIDVGIAEKIVHEHYDNNTNTNDIGLLRLSGEVDYTDFIKPICLPTSLELLRKSYQGINMTVSGWGLTENGTTSDILRKVNVPITVVTDCSGLYGPKAKIHSAILCAGGVRGKDSCYGDSGGPLTVMEHTNFYQMGVVSFGSFECGLANRPAVYTKVMYYMQWIVDNLKP